MVKKLGNDHAQVRTATSCMNMYQGRYGFGKSMLNVSFTS